ncbi:hypothetical protein PENTCL1PPCAC_21328, partial [Pristionchus entomophagus]
REAAISRSLSHKNIVHTIGVCNEKFYIVTEFLSGKDLKTYLTDRKDNLTDSENRTVALQIASAMAHLEKNNIVHRDLAARNILVGDSYEVIKLADFGLARLLLDGKEYYKIDGGAFPWRWTAPEAWVIKDTQVSFSKLME